MPPFNLRSMASSSVKNRGRTRGLPAHRTARPSHPKLYLAFRVMPMKYNDVRRALADAGWRRVRQHGSHEIWVHFRHRIRIIVAGNGSDTVPVGTLASIRKASGLENLR